MRRLLNHVLIKAIILGGGTLTLIAFDSNLFYWALFTGIAAIFLFVLWWTDPARKGRQQVTLECPVAEKQEIQVENMLGDVVEAIRTATSKEDASKIFYAYMERRYRDHEKDAVAAYILRTTVDLGAMDLLLESNRLINGMDHVPEEDKQRYSDDVLERASEMLEENPHF